MGVVIQQENIANLKSFFKPLVHEALTEHHVEAPEVIEFYLVNLLDHFSKTAQVYTPPPEGFKEEPLAFIYARACEANSSERVPILKHLGDFSLYITGFFPMSLNRSCIDSKYYVQMGAAAYSHLSDLTSQKNALNEIFENLANHFVAYADVLSEVSEKTHATSLSAGNKDLLRLYEWWQKTGSTRAKQKLAKEGILPIENTIDSVQ